MTPVGMPDGLGDCIIVIADDVPSLSKQYPIRALNT